MERVKDFKFLKIISLLLISVLSVISFLVEYEKIDGPGMRYFGPYYIRITFFIIPILFFLWFFYICKVKHSIKNIAITLLSYAIWFLISYDLILSLTASLNGAFGGFFQTLSFKIFHLLNDMLHLSLKENFVFAFYASFDCFYFALLYFLFIFENVFLKKFLKFKYKKSDYVLLFLYPVSVFLFSTIAFSILITFENNWHNASVKDFVDLLNHLYTGTIVFGYMMTQGLFFIRIISHQND